MATPVIKPAPNPDRLAMLAKRAMPDRDSVRDTKRYTRSIANTPIKGVRYYFMKNNPQPAIVGFSLRNTGSPTVNPRGLKNAGPLRQYTMLFPDRARENIHLSINDDVKLSGRFSHDNMFRELHFFPRRELPRLQENHSAGLLELTLPTGESVLFHRDTLEISGGALSEAPIDFNKSRYARNNPRVAYRGQYLAISVDQRGESPRRAKVWGQKKLAHVHYPAKYAKACRLSPGLIWDQRSKPGDSEPKLHMLHHSDDSLFAMIEKQCRWDLSALRSGNPNTTTASNTQTAR